MAALRSIWLPGSPFGTYFHRPVDRGMKKGIAVAAVMRKLLIVAAHLIQTQQVYALTKSQLHQWAQKLSEKSSRLAPKGA